jgi:sugar lactone lactonase YvrE
MSFPNIRPSTLLLLLIALAGCGYDRATSSYQLPPTASPADTTVDDRVPFSLDGLWTDGGTSAASVAFDARGTMWVASSGDSRLRAFASASLAGTRESNATRVILPTAGSIDAPSAIAFDRAHRLWVANSGNGTLVRFDTTQIDATGSPVPTVVISGVGRPASMAFDASGALWMSDSRAGTVVKYTPAQLATSGSPKPALSLGATWTFLPSPSGLAFDAAGRLWIAGAEKNEIVAFTPETLARAGKKEPEIILTLDQNFFLVPGGLSFDVDGNLWIMGNAGTIAKLDQSQLASSGSPVPSAQRRLSGLAQFSNLAFWPRPAGLSF